LCKVQREVERSIGQGHSHFAPLDAALLALGPSHVEAVWACVTADEPVHDLREFISAHHRIDLRVVGLTEEMVLDEQLDSSGMASHRKNTLLGVRRACTRARDRALDAWRTGRDEAVCILAHGQEALLRPPASVTAQAAERVRSLAFFALISDGELDGVRRLLAAGEPADSTLPGRSAPDGSSWLRIPSRPEGFEQIEKGDFALEFNESRGDGEVDDRREYVTLEPETLRKHDVQLERPECFVAAEDGKAFYRPVWSAMDTARLAVAKGRGRAVEVLEELAARGDKHTTSFQR